MDVLAIVLVMCLIPIVLAVGAMVFAARSLRRANRVSPRVPTTAPTSWLLLPDRPARLHRRLRRAVTMARGAADLHGSSAGRTQGSAPSSVAELADELERRACVIDAQLVVAARAVGTGRRRMLHALDAQVREVERLAARIAALATSWAATSATLAADPDALRAIGERLDALEAGLVEIRAVAAAPEAVVRSVADRSVAGG